MKIGSILIVGVVSLFMVGDSLAEGEKKSSKMPQKGQTQQVQAPDSPQGENQGMQEQAPTAMPEEQQEVQDHVPETETAEIGEEDEIDSEQAIPLDEQLVRVAGRDLREVLISVEPTSPATVLLFYSKSRPGEKPYDSKDLRINNKRMGVYQIKLNEQQICKRGVEIKMSSLPTSSTEESELYGCEPGERSLTMVKVKLNGLPAFGGKPVPADACSGTTLMISPPELGCAVERK